jgi:hypothetical protein
MCERRSLDDPAYLNVREQIVRIDEMVARIERGQAETRKFVAEQGKLQAEDLKLQRDRGLMPLTAVATLLGAGEAIFAAGAGFIKLIGG